MAVLDKPFLHRSAVRASTDADEAAVFVPFNKCAAGGPGSGKELVQRPRCRSPAGIGLALGVLARLLALRCVDAVEADALTVDFDSVSVNDRRSTFYDLAGN